MKILINNSTSRLRYSDKPNPKIYPYMKDLISLLKDKKSDIEFIELIEPDKEGTLDIPVLKTTLTKLKEELKQFDLFISIDTFLPHYIVTEDIDIKGVVIFNYSDPDIFGYKRFINAYNDRSLFRENQGLFWEEQQHENFIDPLLLSKKIICYLKNNFEL
jgi:hypothetical protein